MIFSDESQCLEILERLKFSVTEIYSKIIDEKNDFNSYYEQLSMNLRNKNKSLNIYIKEEIDSNPAHKIEDSNIDEDIEKLKSSIFNQFDSLENTSSDFLQSVQTKIATFNAYYTNDLGSILDDYNILGKIFSESYDLIKKIHDLKTYYTSHMNNTYSNDKENASKSKISKSIRNNQSEIKKIKISNLIQNSNLIQSENRLELNKFIVTSPIKSQNSVHLQSNAIKSDENINILSDDTYFVDLTDNNYNNFIIELSLISENFKKFINKNFISNLRRDRLGQYNIDYNLEKKDWIKNVQQIDISLSKEEYFFTFITITSDSKNFPELSFTFQQSGKLFLDYFLKFKENQLFLACKTAEKKKFLNIISQEDFINKYKIKKIEIEFYQWFEDAISHGFNNIFEFYKSNIDKQILKSRIEELDYLRKKLSLLVFNKKNEIKNYSNLAQQR